MKRKFDSAFDAGYDLGVNTTDTLSAFEISPCDLEFKTGYVVGKGFIESVRRASAYAGAIEAATLGVEYGIPYASLVPHFNDHDDPQVLAYLHDCYYPGDNESYYPDEE